MIRGREDRRVVLAHQLPAEGERLVGLLVGGPDVALAGGDSMVADAVAVHVVEVRVRIPVEVLLVKSPVNW